MEFDVTCCRLCPRACGADRTASYGFCGGTDGITAARAALHFWEEPCISGTSGSGTVFFSGCHLHCRFCQNHSISAVPSGKRITPARLAEIFLSLQEQGAHNINLVTGSHVLPWILEALDLCRTSLRIPIVYNCGGYESVESIRALNGYTDIYLPDFKFFDAETARSYAKAPDYPEIAEAALAEMLGQTGPPLLKDGLMERGCIVRHLVLPGHRKESIALLEHLAKVFGTDAFLLSLMAQYTPMREDPLYPELNRRITKMEYNSVMDAALELGFQGFFQDKASATSDYTPEFDLSGI